MTSLRSIALMHSHFFGASANAAYDEKQVIHHGTPYQHCCQYRNNPSHTACALILCVIIHKRLYGEAQVHPSLFQFVQRQVVVLHLFYLRLQVVWCDAFCQTHVTFVTIIAYPVIASVKHDSSNGWHTDHHLHTVQFGVQGNVLIDTANGQRPATTYIVVNFFPHKVKGIFNPH